MIPTRRVSLSFSFVFASALVGCSSGGSTPFDAGDTTDGGDVGDASARREASVETDAPPTSCTNQVPCTTDAQCVAVAGTSCNTNTQQCQTVLCGTAAVACSRPSHCKNGFTCAAGRCTEDPCPTECKGQLAPIFAKGPCSAGTTPIDINEGCTRYCKALREADCEEGDDHGREINFICTDGFQCLAFSAWCDGSINTSGTTCP